MKSGSHQTGWDGDPKDLEDQAFLDFLIRNEVELHASEGKIRVSAPVGVLTDELKEELRRRKDRLLVLLEARIASVAIYTNRDVSSPTHSRDDERWAVQFEYWKTQLAGAPAQIELPFSRSRPVERSLKPDTEIVPFLLPETLSSSLRLLAKTQGSSLNALLLSVFAVLVYRYTGQQDLCIGAPLSRSIEHGTASSSGNADNKVVLRLQPQPSRSFIELLEHVRTTVFEAFANSDLPFNKIVTELKPDCDPDVTPFFQLMFDADLSSPEPTCDPPRTPLASSTQAAKPGRDETNFDMTIRMDDRTDSLISGGFRYRGDLFPSQDMRRFAESFITLLQATVQAPNRPISEVSILTEAEQQRILVDWNQTHLELPKDATIHGLFERQVALAPTAKAVIHGTDSISYEELNERANRLAHLLLQRGLQPEECVGICMRRSIDMIAAMLAVLKAGGAYVPLDPTYPIHRLEAMLSDSRARIVLAQEAILAEVSFGTCEAIRIDTDAKIIASMPKSNPSLEQSSSRLAYVIYTSGSTGRPKGVAIEHHSAVSMLHWGNATYTSSELARTLASTSISFDLSVFEIFLPLSFGHTVVLAENILQFGHKESSSNTTLINTVPSAMAAFLASSKIPESVLCVNLAGEPLPVSLVQKIKEQAPTVRIFDLYGPTETTTYSTFASRSPSASSTIGRPLANTQIFILDAGLMPVPTGVPGQMFIGGEGVARGYLHQPKLTVERFLTIEHLPNASRVYQTGDLARYRQDGNIEYLGRMDQQVKIRGFRIELGEVESILRQHPKVTDAAVVMLTDSTLGSSLAAYVTTISTRPQAAELIEFQQQFIPSYMVANEIVILDRIPLTPNGKIDRKLLIELPRTGAEKTPEARHALSHVEKVLVLIWEKHFKRSPIGIDEDFFAIGGHSLLAFQIFSEIEKRLHTPLLLSLLLSAPTIRLLAEKIEQGRVE